MSLGIYIPAAKEIAIRGWNGSYRRWDSMRITEDASVVRIKIVNAVRSWLGGLGSAV